MKKIFVTFIIVITTVYVKAQYNIATNNGQTINICATDFYDNASGNYNANVNQTITFKANLANKGLKMSFNQFDVHFSDTLYVYDGPNTTSPLIGKFNNNNSLSGGQNIVQTSIYNSTNVTGASLTFKFVTNASNQGAGWFASLACIPVCQSIFAKLDSVNTIPHPKDSNYIDICLGQAITFKANPTFPQNGIIYNQNLATSTFTWDFGDGTTGTGQTVNHTYQLRRGYDVMLKVTDSIGCVSTNALGTRIRVASFPTMHINTLPDMCSNQNKLINVGYNLTSTVVVEPISFTQTSKQGFDSTMFIPDGPNCPTQVYNTFVVFNNFPPGVTIQSANDILSICVNMEHSFAGDLGFRIYCPNNQFTQLDPNTHSGGSYLGIPYGGTNHHSYDNGCLQQNNPAGTGWNYCWSEIYPSNNNMTLDQLSSSTGTGTIMVNGGRTIDTTNQINHTNYIVPQTPLSSLIGCPLNGVWNIEITDDYASDNGYIFHWDLQLQANLMPVNWTYNVLVDSVHFSGPFLTQLTDTTANVFPTNGGIYTYNISMYDEFGCKWDTSTKMNVIKMPEVNLGNDTAFCFGNKILLNAGNPGCTYDWITPSGIYNTQTIYTDSIFSTLPNPLLYIASATNKNASGTLLCVDTDSITVTINPMPNISFDILPSPAQGCAPLQVSFINYTTPAIQTYLWEFGDGQTSSDSNVVHTFAAGNYNISLTATTTEGCTFKSITYNLVKSYPQPIAEFTWDPQIGVIQDPHINFTNQTSPNNSSFSYSWNFGDGVSDNSFSPVHIFPALGEYIITLIATSDKGCTDTVVHTVKIINDILDFPNVITPNGDDKNDKFIIKGLLDGGYPETELSIYNRWGKRIYFKANYQNDFGGEDLPDGVYFYIFKGKGIFREVEYKSSLQILR